MARGIPLTNEDRMPWLDALAAAVNAQGEGPVVLRSRAPRRDGPPNVLLIVIDTLRRELTERWVFSERFTPQLIERLEKAGLKC